MSALDSRTDFILRDPAALGALLGQDWRARDWVSDDELIADIVDRPATTGVLRHLQRLGFIRARHGVRAQGGRMRLWTLGDAFKVQAILDLRASTGATLVRCVEALADLRPQVDDMALRCRRLPPQIAPSSALQVHQSPPDTLLCDTTRLLAFIEASMARAVDRCRFDSVVRPAFLLG